MKRDLKLSTTTSLIEQCILRKAINFELKVYKFSYRSKRVRSIHGGCVFTFLTATASTSEILDFKNYSGSVDGCTYKRTATNKKLKKADRHEVDRSADYILKLKKFMKYDQYLSKKELSDIFARLFVRTSKAIFVSIANLLAAIKMR